MWTYSQTTGTLSNPNHSFTGYAGAPGHVNNPSAQELHGLGPLTRGRYTITAPYDNPKTGPFTLNLTPAYTNTMFGRGDFRIHGDNSHANQTASEGCIILPRIAREAIWNSHDQQLEVTA
jgi:Protein of unknown function (DUF2778)